MSSPKSPLDELRIERRPERPSQLQPWLAVVGAVVVLLLLGAAVWWHSRAGAVEVQTALAHGVGGSGGDNTRC